MAESRVNLLVKEDALSRLKEALVELSKLHELYFRVMDLNDPTRQRLQKIEATNRHLFSFYTSISEKLPDNTTLSQDDSENIENTLAEANKQITNLNEEIIKKISEKTNQLVRNCLTEHNADKYHISRSDNVSVLQKTIGIGSGKKIKINRPQSLIFHLKDALDFQLDKDKGLSRIENTLMLSKPKLTSKAIEDAVHYPLYTMINIIVDVDPKQINQNYFSKQKITEDVDHYSKCLEILIEHYSKDSEKNDILLERSKKLQNELKELYKKTDSEHPNPNDLVTGFDLIFKKIDEEIIDYKMIMKKNMQIENTQPITRPEIFQIPTEIEIPNKNSNIFQEDENKNLTESKKTNQVSNIQDSNLPTITIAPAKPASTAKPQNTRTNFAVNHTLSTTSIFHHDKIYKNISTENKINKNIKRASTANIALHKEEKKNNELTHTYTVRESHDITRIGKTHAKDLVDINFKIKNEENAIKSILMDPKKIMALEPDQKAKISILWIENTIAEAKSKFDFKKSQVTINFGDLAKDKHFVKTVALYCDMKNYNNFEFNPNIKPLKENEIKEFKEHYDNVIQNLTIKDFPVETDKRTSINIKPK